MKTLYPKRQNNRASKLMQSIRLFLFVPAILFCFTIKAQTPEKFSYQAVIRNANGSLITDTQISLRISILRGSSSGTISYQELHSPTTDINGLISIEIGTGSVQNGLQIDTIEWQGSNYFIKTEADPENGTNYSISGIYQLLSVPYALHAKTFSGDMQQSKISNLALPTDSQDAVTKSYVDEILNILNDNGIVFCDFWTGSQSLATDSLIYFRDTSTMSVESWIWDFGDGATSTDQHPSHTYSSPGLYTVSLYASNGTISYEQSKENYIMVHDIIAGEGLTDYDGNTYTSIIIGTQEWMGSNLAVIHYPNGSSIPHDPSWENSGNNDEDDAYCWMNNDISTKEDYGALYNYAAACNGTPHSGGPEIIQGVCPAGWHLPSRDEWNTLKSYLTENGYNYNMIQYQRKEGKSMAVNSGWSTEYTDEGDVGFDQQSNNSSGFSGVPVGYRYADKNFYNNAKRAYWWTSSEGTSTAARSMELHNNLPNINEGYHNKSVGMNIRCLKD